MTTTRISDMSEYEIEQLRKAFTNMLETDVLPKVINDMEAIFALEDENIDELKTLGRVTITSSEDDRLITEKITYESEDGAISFDKEKIYYKHRQNDVKAEVIQKQINSAVKKEDYVLAAKLKQELDSLLNCE